MRRLLPIVLLILSIPSIAVAENYYINRSQPGGSSWVTGEHWTKVSDSSTGTVPGAGDNAYIFGTNNMRTPDNTSASNVFPGGVLYLGYNADGTLATNGSIGIKSTNTTFNNLQLGNGTINNSKSPNAVCNIDGAITVNGTTGTISSYGESETDSRSFNIKSLIDGSGTLNIRSRTSGAVHLTNVNNTFSGTMNVVAGSNLYLDGRGTVGTDAVKLTLEKGAKLYSSGDLAVSTLSYMDTADQVISLPSQTTNLNAAQMTALAQNGITFTNTAGAMLQITTGSRAGQTFYIAQNKAAGTPWTNTDYYTLTEGVNTPAGIMPTLGDTLIIQKTPAGESRALRSPEAKTGTVSMLANVILATGGELNLKSAGNEVDIIIPSLELAGGQINHGNGGITMNLSGEIISRADTTSIIQVRQDNNNTRRLNINSDISGSGTLRFINNPTDIANTAMEHWTALNGNNTSFTGTWDVQNYSVLKATSDTSLGTNTKLIIDQTSQVDVSANVSVSTLQTTYLSGYDYAGAGNTRNNATKLTYSTYGLPNQTLSAANSDTTVLGMMGITFSADDATLAITGSRDPQTFYFVGSMPYGETWNTIKSGNTYWSTTSGGTAGTILPTYGDTAVINTNTAFRTPDTDVDTTIPFAATLRLDTGSQLNVKTSGNAKLYFSDLVFNGGALGMGNGAATSIILGNFNVVADSSIALDVAQNDTRTFDIRADISGDKNLTIQGAQGNKTVILSGDNSSFTGTMVVNDAASTLKLNSATALGNGNASLINKGKVSTTNDLTLKTLDYAINAASTGSLPNQVSTLTKEQATALSKGTGVTMEAGDILTITGSRDINTYYLNNNMSGGTTWTQTNYWSLTADAAANSGGTVIPSLGDTVYLNGKTMRTPDIKAAGTYSFLANVDATNSTIGFKTGVVSTNGSNTTAIVYMPYLTADNTTLGQYTDNTTSRLQGTITMKGDSIIGISSVNPRNFWIESDMTGSGNWTLDGKTVTTPDYVRFSGDNSAWTGRVIANSGNTRLESTGVNSLGTSGFTLNGTTTAKLTGSNSFDDPDGAEIIFAGTNNTIEITDTGSLSVLEVVNTGTGTPTITTAGDLEFQTIGSETGMVNLIQNDGVVSLTDGLLGKLYGSYTQNGGSLLLDLHWNPETNQYEAPLTITGDLVSISSIDLSLPEGFVFDDGTTYPLIDVNGVSSESVSFAGLTLDSTLDSSIIPIMYNGVLSLASKSAVPEPSTWIMLIVGLSALAFVRRRNARRSK